jgi:hypothetical protein
MKTSEYQKFGRLLLGVAAISAAGYFFLVVLVVHGDWTGTFESLCLFSGLIILPGRRTFVLIGRYLFAFGLLVFAVIHFIYESFVITWIPGWIPFPVVWAYLVPVGFLGAFVSIAIQKYVRLSSLLLALMFLLWVFIVNLPRALALKTGVEWTGTFIALAMSGISLLIAGSCLKKK